jgi:hypothetical protein
MATRLDERTILSDSFAPFGELAPLPDRPEPTRREAVYLTQADIQKRFRWSADDFEKALQRNFPQSNKRVGRGSWGITLVWKDALIDRWIEETKREAETLAALVARA